MRYVLEMGCLSLGILFLFYYAGIVLYAGITTSIAWIWPFCGVILILLRFALRYQSTHPYTWLRYVTGAALALIMIALAIVFLFGIRIVSAMHTVPKQGLKYVIVLGAQVRGTNPSRALKKRLDRAAEYARENPDTIFILSGGKGTDEEISEAECMHRYMIRSGVSEKRLIKESESTSTRENLIFSAKIIRALHENGNNLVFNAQNEILPEERIASQDMDVSVGILSNDFHIYRALLLAQKVGYTDASGIPAGSDPWMQPHNIMREICALLFLPFTSN